MIGKENMRIYEEKKCKTLLRSETFKVKVLSPSSLYLEEFLTLNILSRVLSLSQWEMKSFKIHLNFKLGERKRSGKQKCINNDKQGNHKTGQ